MEKKEIGIIDYLYILVKSRKLLITSFIIVCVIAAAVSLILPKWYTAETTILPPSEEAGGLGLSSLLSTLPGPGLGLGLGAISEEMNILIAILNSRIVMEAIAKKFDLMKRYDAENMEETIETLQDHVSIEINDEGTITLRVEAGTPFLSTEEEDNEARKLAKDMANFFIEELDRVNTRLKVEKARNTRIFIEKRYHQNLKDLQRAEEEFKQFQQEYDAIALPEQTAAAITAAAELKAEIMAKEVEVNVLSKYVFNSHSDLRKAQNELNELRKKHDEFIHGSEAGMNGSGAGNESKVLFLPFEEVPNIGLQYARLLREVTLQEKLLEFLLPQYEQAKIQEQKDTPTVQVLDPAVAPIKKSRPKRAIIVAIAGLTTLFILVTILSVSERVRMLEELDREKYEKISNLFMILKKGSRFKFLPRK